MDGPEEKAASLLNGGMIMVLSTLLSAFAAWAAADYLWRAIAQGMEFWQGEIFARFLIPLALIGPAVKGFRFGLQMMHSKSCQ